LKIYSRITNSVFARNTAILTVGTALAQGILLISSPVLTRLYTSSDFGLLAIFMAIVTSLAPAICGKYEVALMLPKLEARGVQLFSVALVVTLANTGLFLVFLIFAHLWLVNLLDAEQLQGWLYLTPFALLLMGFFQAGSYFANRLGKYKLIANAKLVQSSVLVLISVFLGIIGMDFSGLILGYVLGLLVATAFIFFAHMPHMANNLFNGWKKKRVLMARYKDYPVFNGSSSLLDGVTQALPVFFLAHYYPDSIVGYFALVLRVASAPLGLISTSVSQINLKKVVDLVNEQRNVVLYIYKLTLLLVAIASIPTALLMVFSPELFAFVFGEPWREAGVYCQIIIPALAIRFVASTLSSTLGATKNNKLSALWKIVAFLSTVIVYAWIAPKGDIITFLYAVLINDALLYILYFIFIVHAAKKPRNLV
jgi:O-antigen/teichoic acid export membrane protein